VKNGGIVVPLLRRAGDFVPAPSCLGLDVGSGRSLFGSKAAGT